MKKSVIVAVVLIMSILGALYGFVLYLLLISVGEDFFLHCISAGVLFGFINSLITLFFINKCSNIKLINEKLEQEIRTDKLTGLISRRAFDSDIKTFNTNIEYSMIYLDIDNFGNFNKKYGHHVGDKVLKSCASVIKNCTRNSDFVYRYGGEEIVVVLSGCGKKEAERIGINIVESIRNYDNSPYSSITISAGIASMPVDASTFEQLIKTSDFALLKAKKQGKDQVVIT